MQSIDSLRELNSKLLAEVAELRKENAEIPELREKLLKFAELEAEKMELRQELKARTDELEKTIADYSVKIGNLNAIIVELEKNKVVTTKLKSENAEFRDRITKVEQRQMLNDNVTKVTNSSNDSNNSSSNFNSADKEMDTSLPEEPISEVITKQSASAVNISVMDQCDQKSYQKSLEDKETDAFLDEVHKKKVNDEIRQRKREKKQSEQETSSGNVGLVSCTLSKKPQVNACILEREESSRSNSCDMEESDHCQVR